MVTFKKGDRVQHTYLSDDGPSQGIVSEVQDRGDETWVHWHPDSPGGWDRVEDLKIVAPAMAKKAPVHEVLKIGNIILHNSEQLLILWDAERTFWAYRLGTKEGGDYGMAYGWRTRYQDCSHPFQAHLIAEEIILEYRMRQRELGEYKNRQ